MLQHGHLSLTGTHEIKSTSSSLAEGREHHATRAIHQLEIVGDLVHGTACCRSECHGSVSDSLQSELDVRMTYLFGWIGGDLRSKIPAP